MTWELNLGNSKAKAVCVREREGIPPPPALGSSAAMRFLTSAIPVPVEAMLAAYSDCTGPRPSQLYWLYVPGATLHCKSTRTLADLR
jgi:hypothetical protein